MKDEMLTKFNAANRMRALGIDVAEENVYVGRFFIRQGHGKKGLGVCFMADYYGFLTPYAFLNKCICVLSFLMPKKFLKNYVVYVKAFSGKHSRKAKYEVMEKTEYVNYDASNISFMADGREWKMDKGAIIPFAAVARRVV